MEKNKVSRILDIYTRLLNGDAISKERDAKEYAVSERSIQRDLEHIQIFLEAAERNNKSTNMLVYDRVTRSYHMEKAVQ